MNKYINAFRIIFYLVIPCVLLILGFSVVGITAYLADGDKAVNEFKVGSNVIDIVEEFETPEDLQPGSEIKKDVRVSNTGTVDCYVRVLAVFADSDMGNHCTIDWHDKAFLESAGYDVSNGYWVYNAQDGYWYFTKPIAANEATPSLFTTVTISDDIAEADIMDFEIIVYSESYQAGEFSNYEDAWENYQKNQPES